MSVSWRHLPKPARAVAEASEDAVAAARARDLPEFERAAGLLAAQDAEHVALVLGTVTRMLLEDLYPGGLTADDVRALVGRCARAAAGWFPGVDADTLVMLVAGALGVHQPEPDAFPIDGQAVARHAALLVADLLEASGHALRDLLGAALADIALVQSADTP
ncbi:hypothetical protein Sme01_19740 [Sphaerisporangium melleum]|uniref:Uncharacterized protein n=1 Tax=Sphaerisporangium melleum TaxID=321316 RepID=A0A917REW1_9ACTN|nr:hypothetical protein [Sphaerisporangium melleum]GGL02644.1 hypothetical protein GCM10007964_50890 [Sphaerisporangium melleum]GII69498.1 hypothetical protein Sme01_19740 [Sphaerisporangium melleum]